MPELSRSLQLFADDREMAMGCRMELFLRESLSLLPQIFRLEIHELSPSSAALLSASSRLRAESGGSVLAEGWRMESVTRLRSGAEITSVVFSPSFSFRSASVSLSLPAGMRVSETLRAVLAASVFPDGTGAAASQSPVPLAAFFAKDAVLARPQAFFGRTCDALQTLADSADADVYLSSAGVCVIGRETAAPSLVLAQPDLLAEPARAGNRFLLSTVMAGWPLGVSVRAVWNGVTREGRILSRLIHADTRSGPWRSELEMSPGERAFP